MKKVTHLQRGKTTRKHIKKWCPKDIKALAALYFMGATDQEAGLILDRTEQAINKKITRLKLRPKNSQHSILAPRRALPKSATLPEISACLHNTLLKIEGADNVKEALLQLYPLQETPKANAFAKHHDPFGSPSNNVDPLISLKPLSRKENIIPLRV